jgi:hypothetical protein
MSLLATMLSALIVSVSAPSTVHSVRVLAIEDKSVSYLTAGGSEDGTSPRPNLGEVRINGISFKFRLIFGTLILALASLVLWPRKTRVIAPR